MTPYAPAWSAVDSDTADLLALVANEQTPPVDREWATFVEALLEAADESGVIRPNVLRPLVRGKVAPRRIGAFTNRALSEGLVAYTGDYEVSDDRTGRNGGKPARVMRLQGGALCHRCEETRSTCGNCDERSL